MFSCCTSTTAAVDSLNCTNPSHSVVLSGPPKADVTHSSTTGDETDGTLMRVESAQTTKEVYFGSALLTPVHDKNHDSNMFRPVSDDDDDDFVPDEGRNPPLYKNPQQSVQAKTKWLQQAFSPAVAQQFQSDEQAVQKKAQGHERISEAVRQWEQQNTPSHTPEKAPIVKNKSKSPITLRSPTAPTYSSPPRSTGHPAKPLPVSQGYKDCSQDDDFKAYEVWYQKGLLRWRPLAFQPTDASGKYAHNDSFVAPTPAVDASGAYQHLESMPSSDFLIDVLSMEAEPTGLSEEQDTAENSVEALDQQQDIVPVNPFVFYHADTQQNDDAKFNPFLDDTLNQSKGSLDVTQERVSHVVVEDVESVDSLYYDEVPSTDVDVENQRLDDSDWRDSSETKRPEDTELQTLCLSRQCSKNMTRQVPIMSLFSPMTKNLSSLAVASPDSSSLSPRERVEYYQNYVHSYKSYIGDRTSPDAKSTQEYAFSQLKEQAATTTTVTQAE